MSDEEGEMSESGNWGAHSVPVFHRWRLGVDSFSLLCWGWSEGIVNGGRVPPALAGMAGGKKGG